MRTAVRYSRWADLSFGPHANVPPIIKAAYWKGVAAALDSIYLSECEHARLMAYNGRRDEIEDSAMIQKVIRRAIAACRRDLRYPSQSGEWSEVSSRKERLEYELTYYLNLGVPPEEAPPFGTRKTRDSQVLGITSDEIGPYNRSSSDPDEEGRSQTTDEVVADGSDGICSGERDDED